MTAAQFRKMALSFPGATESSHNGHPDFRVNGKIFATLGYPDDSCGVVMLSPDEQAFYAKTGAGAFVPAKGAWGAKGSTVVILGSAEPATVHGALDAAWERRASKSLLKELREAR